MRRVIGIDLGTANSCVAVLQDGEVLVIPDEEGHRTQPSVVAINGQEQVIVGHAALRQAESNRTNTIFAVKRLIGRTFESDEVQEFAEKVPYHILPAENGDAWVEINEIPTAPEEVSAHILKRMKEIAERHFSEEIHHAVITVPAHFNDSQRQATKDAGKIAGLQVLSIINEPTAAALAYGLDVSQHYKPLTEHQQDGASKSIDRIIAVFDLGSGTFDVTILALRNGIFDVLATGGDTYLGGEDFDHAIVEHLLEEFKRQHRVDLSKDRPVLQRLKEAAKEAKQSLSSSYTHDVTIPYICAGTNGSVPTDLRVTLDRKSFEKIVQPLLKRLEEPCLQALEDANLQPSQIDDVILVGGMTRMPAVKTSCQRIFGKSPIDTIDPDEAVARGAAIQSGLLQGILKGLQLADVTSLSLGIEVQGGKLVTLLPRNSKIPANIKRVFTTSAPNQTEVTIHLLQGESQFVPENKSLGRFELNNIPLAPRGVPRIEVNLEVDQDGIVHLAAKDLKTGEKKEIEIINSSGLSDDELNLLVSESRSEASHKSRMAERERKLSGAGASSSAFASEIDQIRHDLKSLIFQTQFRLDTDGKHFRGKKRQELQQAIDTAREVLNTGMEAADFAKALEVITASVAELDGYLQAA